MQSREEDKWNLLKHHQTKAIVEKSMHSEIITQTDHSRHRMNILQLENEGWECGDEESIVLQHLRQHKQRKLVDESNS